MKVQIDRIVLEPAGDKSSGLIEINGHLCEDRYTEFTVEFHFPDNHDLFSPSGSYHLWIKYDTLKHKQIKLRNLDCDQDEQFRDILGSFNTVCPQRLRKACEALFTAIKPQ